MLGHRLGAYEFSYVSVHAPCLSSYGPPRAFCLSSHKDLSSRLKRCASGLQEWDIRLSYRADLKHKAADVLSSSPLPPDCDEFPSTDCCVSPVDIHLMSSEQKEDPWISSILNLLSGSSINAASRKLRLHASHFGIREKMLFRSNYQSDGEK